MIRIYKDNDYKIVTQGAYNSLYAPLGYKIVTNIKVENNHPAEVIKHKAIGKTNKEESSNTKRKKGE